MQVKSVESHQPECPAHDGYAAPAASAQQRWRCIHHVARHADERGRCLGPHACQQPVVVDQQRVVHATGLVDRPGINAKNLPRTSLFVFYNRRKARRAAKTKPAVEKRLSVFGGRKHGSQRTTNPSLARHGQKVLCAVCVCVRVCDVV